MARKSNSRSARPGRRDPIRPKVMGVSEDGDERRTRQEEDDAKIVQEAKDRFKYIQDWESEFHNLYVQDVKFRLGDSDNGWQWPDDLRADRANRMKPTLTINKTAPLCNLIVNDMRKNKPRAAVKPAHDASSYKAAQVYEGVFRYIEYISRAQSIYVNAATSQVDGGVAYWRVTTRYVDDTSFDQDIIIAPVYDQMGVYLDRNIKQQDGSDARYGFIFGEMSVDEFKRENPGVALPSDTGLGEDDADDWVKDGNVRVAEYYRLVDIEPDELIYIDDGETQVTFKKSEMPEGAGKLLLEAESNPEVVIKRRKITRKQLEWYKIASSAIIDRKKLPGKYIPIIRSVGIERIVEGKLVRKGHVRDLKDAQRMYNYNTSGQTEVVALQTKTPFTGAAAAFMGNENAWNDLNVKNPPYISFNHLDPQGEPLPEAALPRRLDPPTPSTAFIEGLKIAASEMEMVGNQYADQKGQISNAESGKAIAERQHQSDTANYHFTDNQAVAIRHTCVVILDLFPKVFDTKRVIQILGLDNKQTKVQIDPEMEEEYREELGEENEIKEIFLNPNIGRYEVEADMGPAYSTQRQEAWNAFTQIVVGAPELIQDIGDMMFQSADFPLADKIAERLRRKIKAEKPYLFDDKALTPLQQQMKQELEAANQQVAELLAKLAETNMKLKGKDQRRDIEAYRAETSRVKDLANSVEDLAGTANFEQLMKVILQTLSGMPQDITNDINAAQRNQQGLAAPGTIDQHAQKQDEQAPMQGAKRAKDGRWYVPDPDRPGKYMRVSDQAQQPEPANAAA